MVNFAEPPPHVLRVPRWVLAIHAVQVLFAIIILGLDAFGIRWVAYNALIYSLVVCICTLGVCAYLLGSQLFLHQFYNMYIALALHLWMLLFWIIDLGLVANLARLWSGGYYTSYGYIYTWDFSYVKRDLHSLSKRDYVTWQSYYGALAAGAVFASVQFMSWIACTVILLISFNKQRQNAANPTNTPHPPSQYGANDSQAVPMEKFGQTSAQTQAQPIPQQQYAQPVQQQYTQPVQQQYAQQPQPQQQFGNPYPQDPVPRQDTVSPVSQVGYSYAPPSNVSELGSPQHTGAYHPNVSELSERK